MANNNSDPLSLDAEIDGKIELRPLHPRRLALLSTRRQPLGNRWTLREQSQATGVKRPQFDLVVDLRIEGQGIPIVFRHHCPISDLRSVICVSTYEPKTLAESSCNTPNSTPRSPDSTALAATPFTSS
eukprot:1004327-Prorocentrum_minimum.AAC.2